MFFSMHMLLSLYQVPVFFSMHMLLSLYQVPVFFSMHMLPSHLCCGDCGLLAAWHPTADFLLGIHASCSFDARGSAGANSTLNTSVCHGGSLASQDTVIG